MDRVKNFVDQNFKTDPEKFGYWEAFGSLLLTPFEVQQRKYAYPKPEPVDHAQAEASTSKEDTTKAEMGKPADTSKAASNGKSGQNTHGGEKGNASFTAAEDATLKEMKDNGDVWGDIAKALNKSQKACKKRYAEIATPEQKTAAANHADEKKVDAKKGQGKKGEGKKSQKQQASEDKKPDEHVSAPQLHIPAFINGLQNVTLFPDEVFGPEDLVWFCSAFNQDNQDRFVRLSSRFYDMTGRRIHPRLIMEKLMNPA